MQEQWDLGAGEDSVVSFQKAVKGYAKEAGVCRRREEQNRIGLISPEDQALDRGGTHALGITNGGTRHATAQPSPQGKEELKGKRPAALV